MVRGRGALPVLNFRSGGMYKPLSGCRNKWSHSFHGALRTGMLLHPAPLQGLHPGFSVNSRVQRWPQNAALMGTAVESPRYTGPHGSPSLHQQVETATARLRLSLSRRLWEDGAAVVAHGWWFAASWRAAPTLSGG